MFKYHIISHIRIFVNGFVSQSAQKGGFWQNSFLFVHALYIHARSRVWKFIQLLLFVSFFSFLRFFVTKEHFLQNLFHFLAVCDIIYVGAHNKL